MQATCCGTWDTAVIAGLDERGEQPAPFLSIIMEPMAGGYGARPHADGIDTGGLFCIPMGRVPDVEMTEFLYPVLTLWRREVPDSGGPGRHRGGLGASIAITPHGTSVPMGLVLASAGKAVAQNAGLCGGHPGNSGLDVVARRSRVAELLASGHMPAELDEVSDELEPGQNYASSYLAPGEVFAMTWQGGGGYGDPLTRDPEAVAHDLRERKVTEGAAVGVYGVVVDGRGGGHGGDGRRTRPAALGAARRARGPSASRAARSTCPAPAASTTTSSSFPAATVACGHCGQVPRRGRAAGRGALRGTADRRGPADPRERGRLRRRARGVPAVLLPVLLDGAVLRGGARRRRLAARRGRRRPALNGGRPPVSHPAGPVGCGPTGSIRKRAERCAWLVGLPEHPARAVAR